MNVLAILESDIMKNLIEDVLMDETVVQNVKFIKPNSDLHSINYKSVDMIIIDVRNEYEKVLSYIEKIKKKYSYIKVIVIDVRKRSKLFKRFIKCRAEGYIVDILDKEEFAYIMHKIIMDLLQELFDEDEKNGRNKLTIRENEILSLVGDGYNNKEISQKLFITENTVKKHVSSIFTKLGFKSRKEVISYLKKNKRAMYL